MKARTRLGLHNYHLRKIVQHYRLSTDKVTIADHELKIPATIEGIAQELQLYGLHEANQALMELKERKIKGAKVLSLN